MNNRIGRRNLWRGLRDLALGAGLFVILSLGLAGHPSHGLCSPAAASEGVATVIEAISAGGAGADDAVVAALTSRVGPARAGRREELFILGLSFALMFAFNLAIWRHLRRVYASPRRGAWRRGR